MKRWSQRPLEQRTLLNPGFLAVLATETAHGHVDEEGGPLPFAMAFLALPLVIHEPARERLPTISTSMFAWVQEHPEVRMRIPSLAVQFVDPIREAIRFGAARGSLAFGPRGSLEPRKLARARYGVQTTELIRCRDRAYFTGRWIARAGDPGTVLAAWGLSV